MSVAFRRESDEEHKEPRFELPIPPGPNLVTARGLEQIGEQIAAFEAAVAAAEEDDGRAAAERDLRYWRTRLATAELTEAGSTDEVGFGMQVDYRLNGKKQRIEITGVDEADPALGKIAFTAPLARAMIGLAVGETGEFQGKDDAIEILAIA
jgi:transcription elongation GreA/GreB family factor